MDLEGTFYQLIFTVIRHSFPLARTQISYNFKYISNIFQAYLNLIQNCYQQITTDDTLKNIFCCSRKKFTRIYPRDTIFLTLLKKYKIHILNYINFKAEHFREYHYARLKLKLSVLHLPQFKPKNNK